MEETGNKKERAARDILALMGHKALFEYIPEMEISVPDSDKRNSLDKIAYYYRSEEIVLSDLYIGYVIALYKYTIPNFCLMKKFLRNHNSISKSQIKVVLISFRKL